HVLQRVPQQRAEEVFLVGEVQVERAVRDAGPADHVVDADAVEAPLLKLDRAGLEQLAHGLATLRAQLTVAGGLAAAARRPPLRFARGASRPALRPSRECLPGTVRLATTGSHRRLPYGPAGRAGGRLGGTPVCLLRHSQSVAVAASVPAHTARCVA